MLYKVVDYMLYKVVAYNSRAKQIIADLLFSTIGF